MRATLPLRVASGLVVACGIAASAVPDAPAHQATTNYLVVWLKTEEGRSYRPVARELESFRNASEFAWSGIWEDLEAELLEVKPAHLALVLPPTVIDANLPRRLAGILTRFDDDPFLDCRVGFITGSTTQDALHFVRAIAKASGGDVPDRVIRARTTSEDESLRIGPASLDSAIDRAMRDVRLEVGSRDPDWRSFIDNNRHEFQNAGIIEIRHGGSEGMEDFVPTLLSGASLFPSIVINGSVHSERENSAIAATLDDDQAAIESRPLLAEMRTVLDAIEKGAVAVIARLTPESPDRTALEEWLLLEGNRSIGEALRVSHDDLVIGALDEAELRRHLIQAHEDGVIPVEAVALHDDVAHRVLFGDPAFVPLHDRRPTTHAFDLVIEEDTLRVGVSWTELEKDPWVWDPLRLDSGKGDPKGRVYERIVLPAGFSIDRDRLPTDVDVTLTATFDRRQEPVPAACLVLREIDPDGRSVLHVLVRGPRFLMDRRVNPKGPDRLDADVGVQLLPMPTN